MTTRSTHPGAILREDVLPALFAEQTGIDVETLQEILAERADVTPEIAEKLGKRLGNGADIWLALQRRHNELRDINATRYRTLTPQEELVVKQQLADGIAKARETVIKYGIKLHQRVAAIKAKTTDEH